MLPEGLGDRFRELRRRPAERARLRAEREAAVERVVFGTDLRLWLPHDPLDPPSNQDPFPRLLAEAGPGAALAGLGADGRAVLVRGALGRDGEPAPPVVAARGERGNLVVSVRLATWSERRVEIVGFLTHDSVSHVTWVDLDDAGRPVLIATAGVPHNDIGKGAEIAWCEWDGDRCARVRKLSSHQTDRWFAAVLEGEYDEAGLVRVRRGTASAVTDAETARRAVDAISTELVRWEREYDGHDPDPLPPAEAAAAWVEAGTDAALRAVQASSVPDPILVKIFPRVRHEPPLVTVIGTGFRDAIGGRMDLRQALLAERGEAHPLLPFLDSRGRRAYRSLRPLWQLDERDIHAAFQRRLADVAWPNEAIAMVPAEDGAWRAAIRTFGRERVERVLGVGTVHAAAPRVDRAPTARGDVTDLLARFGLPVELADGAAWGLALVPGGRGASRIGGRPELPGGMPWPAAGGRALTHLATIALPELPDVEGRDVLPEDGTLVLFADLTEDGELYEPVVVGEDERVVVVHVAGDVPVQDVEPPDDDRDENDVPVVLRERRVAFRPVLSLPDRPGGMSDADALVYERLYEALLEVTPELTEPGHLVLGHPVVVQEDPRDSGQISVLHLGWDEALGFEFLDGGDITFFGDADDVRAGRWDRLIVSTASC